jgi:hypothetical protein
VPLLGHHVEHESLEREAGVVERARDLRRPSTVASITWPVSSAYSWAASSAAPSTPARGPWRARRMLHEEPAPGTVYFHATSRAGPSRNSPAADTPPPTTISSGSNIVIALAIPIPSRSPRIRRQRIDASSPSRAPSTTS